MQERQIVPSQKWHSGEIALQLAAVLIDPGKSSSRPARTEMDSSAFRGNVVFFGHFSFPVIFSYFLAEEK
jgi:hypothetical protein